MLKQTEEISAFSQNRHPNSYQLSTRDFLRGTRFTVPSARPLHSKWLTVWCKTFSSNVTWPW